ncbi:hypothetical protein R5R35_013205 [Gryllus longicercus]|uniref:Uncharacterized protein n=1 Tax=Gryllus longicercus TaxID=2509291 RepID=A0AAN9W5B6_9ORTH
MFRWNEKDLIAYEERILSVQKEKAILEQCLDNARQEGEEKNVMNVKVAVAKNLLKVGISVDLIAESTGVSQAEIVQLTGEIS